MTEAIESLRVDEIAPYYKAPSNLNFIISLIFWITAALSLGIPYISNFEPSHQDIIKTIYILLVIIHFLSSLVLSIYLIPLAERKRRRQLLSDAFDTPLIKEKTKNYYNNEFPPSIKRLGANVMENSFFSREIASHMLMTARCITGVYMLIWLILFTSRHSSLDLMLWITQLVFSGAVVMKWLQLEFLRFRHDQTYEVLYSHFLGGHTDSAKSTAAILDAYAAYETTKASAGIVLSSKLFEKINKQLSSEWNSICSQLKMKSE